VLSLGPTSLSAKSYLLRGSIRAMNLTLCTSDPQAEALRRQAAVEGRSIEEVALSAIDDYIARQAEEARAAALEAFIVGLGNPR
jgi:hypothetical protein